MKTEYRIWVGKRLRQYRKLKHYTQFQMASFIEIPLKTYQSYEEGRAAPSLSVTKKFCDNCDITVDEFLQECPDKNKVAAC